jgi:hypothetical protein
MSKDMNKNRQEWIVCGRLIGTATSWDDGGGIDIVLHDFEPAEKVSLPPAKSIIILFEEGLIEAYEENGQVIQSFDLIDTLADAERREL